MKRSLVAPLVVYAALASALEAPNVVTISPQIVTSGQPREAEILRE